MNLLKIFFKTVYRGVLPGMIMFIGITILVTVLVTTNNNSSTQTDIFEAEKITAAVINRDDSEISQKLADYIAATCKTVSIEDTENGLTDALFYGKIDCAAVIPAGFGKSFEGSTAAEIETVQRPDSAFAAMFSTIINGYLSTAKLYLNGTGSIDYAAVEKDLSVSVDTSMTKVSEGDMAGFVSKRSYYMNYLTYALMGAFITCVSMSMSIFNDGELRRRISCSNISQTRYSLQLFLGNSIVCLTVYILLLALSFILFPDDAFSKMSLWLYVSGFSMSVTCLCLGFFLSSFIKKTAASAVSNVLTLGCCFLGGVFVPQQYLSNTVKKIAVINPAYWYVSANNKISKLESFSLTSLSSAFVDIGRLLLFGLVFAAAAMVIYRKKSVSDDV